MKIFIMGMIAGVVLSGLIFLFVLYPLVKNSWYQQGRNNGSVGAKYEIATKLRNEFGAESEAVNAKPLFTVKTTVVYVIDQEGRKTIKVVD